MPSAHSWKSPQGGYLTREAAHYLRVSERTLIRWRGLRVGPAWTKAGQRVLYRQGDLDAYLNAQRVEPVGEVSA